ncbi:MAG TPA: transglutaminase-like domain-containing protein [Thermoanaerobaculia bacterium]
MRKLLFLLLATAALPLFASDKTFEATYVATIKDVPAGLKTMTVWIPLPVSRGGQTVSDVRIDSPLQWMETSENTFGDRYAYTKVSHPAAGDFMVKVHFRGTRNEVTTARLAERRASKAEIARALRADKLVTLSPRVKKLANEVTAGKTTPVDQAHAIYDYLLATMKYDKTIPGWGHGDTERACDIKAGNCTDFHSLFISMARAKGIPARFVIGFPMTSDHGTVTGYHCWAEFYVNGKGWIPVDPSEASKTTDAARRAYLFGNLDPDRVQFTMGRDLVLNPRTSEPLNYFIYPHAEANGKEIGTPAIALEYATVPAPTKTASIRR